MNHTTHLIPTEQKGVNHNAHTIMATVVNPDSGRRIKVGGAVYKRLVAKGVLLTNGATSKEQQPREQKVAASALAPKKEIVAPTLPLLPSELLAKELFIHLTASEIIGLCNSNRAHREACIDQQILPTEKDDAAAFWLNRFANETYEERREDFMTLMKIPAFYGVILAISSQKEPWIDSVLLDDYHLTLVAQGKDEKAAKLIKVRKELSGYSFTAPYLSLTQIDDFVKALRTKQPKKEHYKLIESMPELKRGKIDPRFLFIGDALYNRLEEKEIPGIISTALGRVGEDSTFGARPSRLHHIAYLLFVSLVEKKKTTLINQTIALVKKKETKKLLEKIRDEGVSVEIVHLPFAVSPRDLAYRFVFEIMDAMFYVYNPHDKASVDREKVLEDALQSVVPSGYEAYDAEFHHWFEYYRRIFVEQRIKNPHYDDIDFGYVDFDDLNPEESGPMVEPEREWIRKMTAEEIRAEYGLRIDQDLLF